MASVRQPIPSWIPLLLAVAAFACAALFAGTESDAARRYAGAFFALALGTALILWGVNDLALGHLRARSRRVHRSEHPRLFWVVILVKRFIPGTLLLPAGLYLVLADPFS